MNIYRAMLIFVFGAVLFAGCRSETSLQYDESGFKFDYPEDWQLMSELWPNYQAEDEYYELGVTEVVMITSVQKQGESGAYFAVATAPLPEGLDLEAVYHQTYASLMPELRDVEENPVTVYVEPGFEIRYQRPWGESWWQFHDIWLEKNGVIYVLSGHALPGAFDQYFDDYLTVLNSFRLEKQD